MLDSRNEKQLLYLEHIKKFTEKYNFELEVIDLGKMNRIRRAFVRGGGRALPCVDYAGNIFYGGISEESLKRFINWSQTNWIDEPLNNEGKYVKKR